MTAGVASRPSGSNFLINTGEEAEKHLNPPMAIVGAKFLHAEIGRELTLSAWAATRGRVVLNTECMELCTCKLKSITYNRERKSNWFAESTRTKKPGAGGRRIEYREQKTYCCGEERKSQPPVRDTSKLYIPSPHHLSHLFQSSILQLLYLEKPTRTTMAFPSTLPTGHARHLRSTAPTAA